MRRLAAIVLAALALPAAASAGTVFLLDGRGWGHGVGMSQWGAEGYARHGWDYRRILAHYYQHTSIALAHPRPVRVLLHDQQTSVRIGSTAPFLVEDARGKKLHYPARSLVVDARFVLRHERLRPPLRFVAGVQPLQVDFDPYRGDVIVERSPNGGLMVVNELPLDRYLRGVVPWEAPKGWHFATYEAQAVAARSYTLATLKPKRLFDLYPDERSQMYGGVRAERPETNLAIGATAGQVLVYEGRIIPAYYFSTSGGRTSSIHDAWPKAVQVPYLVSVPDPYDYISPRHVWPTTILTAARLGAVLGLGDVSDAVVVENSSGRAAAVRVLAGARWHTVPANVFRVRFGLHSTDFELRAMALDPLQPALFGARVAVHGWVRGLGRARLQELTSRGWTTVAHLHPSSDGKFVAAIRAARSTQLRLAYNALAGDAVPLEVAPRVELDAAGTNLRVRVSPRLPLLVQRLTRNAWRPVARANGVFARILRPGSYRVAVLGGAGYLSKLTRPVGLRRSGG
ncbi:MAG TPA: SpoIID/LytB domain-containing protein [Gaiellaceae bacterium]|nr:SpoIID/LytB domain-containing protein [Gaiellaceae bacterium]